MKRYVLLFLFTSFLSFNIANTIYAGERDWEAQVQEIRESDPALADMLETWIGLNKDCDGCLKDEIQTIIDAKTKEIRAEAKAFDQAVKRGEIKPVGSVDQMAIDVFSNTPFLVKIRKAVQDEMMRIGTGNLQYRLENTKFRDLYMPVFTDESGIKNYDNWYINYGFHLSAKVIYDMFEQFGRTNSDSDLLTDGNITVTENYTSNTYPDEFHIKTSTEQVGVNVDFYWLPGSHIAAYKINGLPDNNPRLIPYFVITNVNAFPPGYSVHTVSDPTIDVTYKVYDRSSVDFKRVYDATVASLGEGYTCSWESPEGKSFIEGTSDEFKIHTLRITVPKMYQAIDSKTGKELTPEQLEDLRKKGEKKKKKDGLGEFIKGLLGGDKDKK